MVSDIPAGDGKIAYLFTLQALCPGDKTPEHGSVLRMCYFVLPQVN
jgi:hypothetical protein